MHCNSSKNWPLLLNYGLFLIVVILTSFIIIFSQPVAWHLMLVFYISIFLPGFSLSRLLKIESESTLDNLIYWMVLGFIFLFINALLAMILGLTLNSLIWLFISLAILLFLSAFIKDYFWQKERMVSSFIWKEIFNADNLVYLLLFVITFFSLCLVDFQGANFKGDPSYHLAIMRKVVSQFSLTTDNLNYVKNELDILYGFPLWHIVLGALSKIRGFDIFNTWGNISVSLTALVLVVWFWFFKKILPNKYFAVIAWIIFVAFMVNGTKGYLFTRLPVPDTLTQYLFLPLAIGMAFQYIIDFKKGFKYVAIISLLILFIVSVHLVQYFYYLLVMIIAGGLYLLGNINSKNFKRILQRWLIISFANLIVILPFLIVFQLKQEVVTKTLSIFMKTDPENNFSYDTFKKISIYAKLAYIFSPLILIFTIKNKKLFLILGSLLIAPLIFYTPLKSILAQILSDVFMKRLFYNVTWFYAVWAIILGFILLLIDRAINKIGNTTKYLKYIINILIMIIFIVIFYFQSKNRLLTHVYQNVFSEKLSDWLVTYYLWIMILMILISIGFILLMKRSDKLIKFFNISEYRNKFVIFIFISLIAIFMLAPSYSVFRKYYKTEKSKAFFLNGPRNSRGTVLNITSMGGQESIDFINKNIPAKSVFEINNGYFLLPMLIDQYLPTYDSVADKTNQDLFKNDIILDEKLKIIKHYNINYLMMTIEKSQNREYFDKYPEYFTKIYDQGALIYQTNLPAINQYLESALNYQT